MPSSKAPADLSALKAGTKIQAESDGVYYAAEVVAVSDSAKRAKAPIKVHFLGYDKSYDMWVSVKSVRSKLLSKKPARNLFSMENKENQEEANSGWWLEDSSIQSPKHDFEEVSFKKSEFKHAVDQHHNAAAAFVSKLVDVAKNIKEKEAAEPLIRAFHGAAGLPQLQDCIFVGHTATDMDSISSAIGAAYLFNGVAAAASEVNSETEFALAYWGLETPEPYLKVAAEKKRNVCLLDHNQASQMAEGIETSSIVGIIDHHAIQAGIIAFDKPIYVDIRPWGSACTIIAQMAMRRGIMVPTNIAGILLSGILSDTLNLQSPTTTSWDKKVSSVLALLAKVKDPDELASKQFAAKAKALDTLSDCQVINGDCKTFKMKSVGAGNHDVVIPIAWGTVETTDVDRILLRKDDLIAECQNVRTERGVDLMFLSVVDVLKLESFLLVAGDAELSVAMQAFPNSKPLENVSNVLSLGGLVSRKADFVPPVAAVIASGWKAPPVVEAPPPPLPLMVECTVFGCRVRRCKTLDEAQLADLVKNSAEQDDAHASLEFQSVFGAGSAKSKLRRARTMGSLNGSSTMSPLARTMSSREFY